VERACRSFQRLTGRSNVWLALHLTNLSIVVYFVWAGLFSWASDGISRVLVGVFCGGLLYLLTQTIFRVPIEAYEAASYRRLAKGARNPRRLRDAHLRISFLMFSVLFSYPVFLIFFYPLVLVYFTFAVHLTLLTYLLIVITTIVLYLLACDPLPPCPDSAKARAGAPVQTSTLVNAVDR
jgi:hypothetical protein